jgi:hypothetical protein
MGVPPRQNSGRALSFTPLTMLQASAQAADFKVGRHFGEGQAEGDRVARCVSANRNQSFRVAAIVTIRPSLRREIDNPEAKSPATTHVAGSRSFL